MTVDSLCTLLERAGHENLVLYGRQSGPLLNTSRSTFYIDEISSDQSRPAPDKLERAKAFVESEKPDIVQFHDCENFELMSFLSRRYPSLLYLYNHALTCPSGTRYYAASHQICAISTSPACLPNRYLKRCGSRHPALVWQNYRRNLRLAEISKLVSKIIVISEYMQQTLLQAGYSRERIKVIPSLSPAILADCEEISEPPAGNLLLFAGRITEIKGLEVLLQSLPFLKTPWKLVGHSS